MSIFGYPMDSWVHTGTLVFLSLRAREYTGGDLREIALKDRVWSQYSRLGNLVTGFMISDESGNRFFPTAVTDYWQDRAGITYQQTYFSEFFQNLRTVSYLELSIKSDSAIRASMSSQKLHNMSIWLRLVSISSIRQLFHKQVHGSCLL